MRIWSLHPKYLDAKGLVALWRETLLSLHVLEGRTKGYKNHPQLNRFRKSKQPVDAIRQYLTEIFAEACRRNYNFDRKKMGSSSGSDKLPVTSGQCAYEIAHLLNKLEIRDNKKYNELKALKHIETHPLFHMVEGGVEDGEIVTPQKKSSRPKKQLS